MTTASATPLAAGMLAATQRLSYAEAAELTGLSADTIERDRRAGRYPGAAQDDTPARTWRIPIADLVAAGRLEAGLVAQAEQELAARRESRQLAELRERVIRLEEQLAAAQALAAQHATTVQHQQRILELLARKAG
jgi:hypothetical protein